MMADLSWIGTYFTLVKRSDGYITGIVNNEDELRTLLENFKRATLTAYNKWSDHMSENSKARLLWQVEDDSDNIPLCVTRRIILACQHGKGYSRRSKVEHVYTNKRFHVRKGKKVNCPAKLFIRQVTRFDTYNVKGDPSRAQKEDAMKKLKQDMAQADPPHSTFIHENFHLWKLTKITPLVRQRAWWTMDTEEEKATWADLKERTSI
ncbi:uncharacterized protein LOC115423720 isoform X2 [Sphaeramia orbicularis]|uniref:uncharacterized protein LOC115423720 isoform X2 n=1 Tax=Sphaeramia orbicularis TaxID=375764 RepID=UPI00117C43EF|nr:uncharacterized protein LOC115423720 isoform X2 [Sphaeramia orbicularis]